MWYLLLKISRDPWRNKLIWRYRTLWPWRMLGTVLSNLGACSGNMDCGPTIFLVSSMRATISATASSRVSSSTRRFLLVSLPAAPSSSEPSWDRFLPPGRQQNKVSVQELSGRNQCCGSGSGRIIKLLAGSGIRIVIRKISFRIRAALDPKLIWRKTNLKNW